VADPYRWLEDTDSAQTQAWVATQNALTFSFLEAIPARQSLHRRLTELWDYPRMSAPVKRGGRYFHLRNSGLQNQDALYVLDTLAGEPRLLLDPNTLSTDGTVALSAWAVSTDGAKLAYATSASGSDWLTWRVRDVATGGDMPDVLEWSKFSGASWLKDGSGFFYSRYDAPAPGAAYSGVNYNQKIYLHRLGLAQAQDELVDERPDQKEWLLRGVVSDDGRYLIIYVAQGTDSRNRLFYKDLQSDGPVVELISDLEALYGFVGNDGPQFYLHTNLDAPRGRVIAVDTSRPDRSQWKTLVPQSADVLEDVGMVNNQFVAVCMHDAHHVVRLFALDGQPAGDVDLPGLGSVGARLAPGVSANRDDSELFYIFQSFTKPASVYRYDCTKQASELVYTPPLNFDLSPYETRQTFVASKDGARVPMFVVQRRDLAYNGENPTLLYGYGGFNISLTPWFSASWLVWLEMGGVLAVANLRGGGEYGEEWHQAGMLDKKQNVFDDFIACAEHLIAERITRSARLAIQGGSNGGLLVGACMTQRPDLFGAALPAVGVMDMLRFHKFTIGWAWVSDYGSADDPQQFKTLYAYSPLHNLKPGVRYPATLITTADHDDRVVPGHSFKFAAALQAAQGGDAPALIRIQVKAGHGAGKPTAVVIAEQADIFAFLTRALGL
jgi:prolyl oligopeptidase